MPTADDVRETIDLRTVGAKLQPRRPGASPEGPARPSPTRMRYYSMSRDEENRRQVDPYHLFSLVGYCRLWNMERIFAVERISELKVLTSASRCASASTRGSS